MIEDQINAVMVKTVADMQANGTDPAVIRMFLATWPSVTRMCVASMLLEIEHRAGQWLKFNMTFPAGNRDARSPRQGVTRTGVPAFQPARSQ